MGRTCGRASPASQRLIWRCSAPGLAGDGLPAAAAAPAAVAGATGGVAAACRCPGAGDTSGTTGEATGDATGGTSGQAGAGTPPKVIVEDSVRVGAGNASSAGSAAQPGAAAGAVGLRCLGMA